jgi:hypothetical protein
MGIEVKRVSSKSELKQFIYLPEKIHRGHENWLPPLYVDEWNFFNPKKNKSFGYSETILAMAYHDGKPVGRIMGIINKRYNELKGENNARFGYLECYNDTEISHALLQYIERWAKDYGCTRIVGPYGFSDKDPQGFMVDGFEHPPLIAAACNWPWIVPLLEAEGYTKEVDCLVFMFHIHDNLPPLYSRINERVEKREGVRLVEFSSKKQMKPYIIPIFRLMNETYSELYGFVPLEEQEMTDFAARYMPILDPRFIKAVEYKGEMAAFIIGIPSMTKGIQKSKGRLLPFGLFHIMAAAKKTKQIDLMLGAVKNSLQGQGLEILMALKLLESMKNAGFEQIEIHLVLETNHRMIAEMNRAGASIHKRFRVFGKDL